MHLQFFVFGNIKPFLHECNLLDCPLSHSLNDLLLTLQSNISTFVQRPSCAHNIVDCLPDNMYKLFESLEMFLAL